MECGKVLLSHAICDLCEKIWCLDWGDLLATFPLTAVNERQLGKKQKVTQPLSLSQGTSDLIMYGKVYMNLISDNTGDTRFKIF